MADIKYYVFCDNDCKYEGMTKEQIIAAIAEATGAIPTDIDSAFITKIKEKNNNSALSFWLGTESEFNALNVDADKYRLYVDSNGEVYIVPESGTGSVVLTATVGTAWSGSSAPFTQTIAISGILATDSPSVDIATSTAYNTAEAELEAFGAIYKIVANDGSITVYASEKTSKAFTIKLKLDR